MVSDDICVAEVRDWADGLEEVRELIGPRFARTEPRENAVAYLRGLLSGAERKNWWTLSEQAGQAVPDRMQRLLSGTDWDPDSVRDDLRSYVVQRLGARCIGQVDPSRDFSHGAIFHCHRATA